MIDELLEDAKRRMNKSVDATAHEFNTVRTVLNSCAVASTDLSIRRFASSSSSSIMLSSGASR